MEYDEDVKNYNDWFAITQTIVKKNFVKGFKIGYEMAIAENIEIGMKSIVRNMKDKGIRLTAKKMKDEGINLKIISEITGLGEEEIKNL
jgi:hypothetical protein